jgi:hypothetical protein
VVAAQGRGKVRPALIPDASEALALGQTLWQPRAAYEWVNVRAIDGEAVHVALPGRAGEEAVLHVGPKADLLRGASQALVGVGTIGPELEEQVSRLGSDREGLKSYMLDTVGVLVVGAVGAALRCLAEETAAGQGLGVSLALAPGSLLGWSLRGQRELCALLDLESIGVQLNSHNMLVPQKSSSVLIGLGPGYTATKVGSVCKYCALQGTCWRRRGDS